VIEVDRPNRQARRRHGKSNPIDAIEAARAALSGRADGVAKAADGNSEAIGVLMVAFRSGREAHTRCLNQLRRLGFCGPAELRERCRDVRVDALAQTVAGLRPNPAGDVVMPPRWRCRPSPGGCSTSTPTLFASMMTHPVGEGDGAKPARVAWRRSSHRRAVVDRRRRQRRTDHLRSRVCASLRVAPIHASSGKTVRHRLNRGGNRQANHALWRIVFTRMGSDERTRVYVDRRLAEGRSKPEIMRVLKRYVAREVYRHLPR